MRVRTVVVAHRETLAAEGIAAALSRYPGIMPVGIATTAVEAERCAEDADGIAIDVRIPGAREAVDRLRTKGLRVVMIGTSRGAEEDEGISVGLQQSVAHLASALAPGIRPDPSGDGGLTQREGQVLRLAAKGMAGGQIARALGISPKTVEQHKTRAFRRLGVPNQTAAVALLVEGRDGRWSRSTI